MPHPFAFLLGLQGGLLLLGASGMLLLGLPWGEAHPLRDPFLAAGLLLALGSLESLFGKLFPASFGEAERLQQALGQALRAGGLGPGHLLLLAVLSGVAEEVFFRGCLQGFLASRLGVGSLLLQALLFALAHPAPRRAFAYPLYTGLAGLLLGGTFWLSGSLLPGILAHALHNARGFYALWRG